MHAIQLAVILLRTFICLSFFTQHAIRDKEWVFVCVCVCATGTIFLPIFSSNICLSLYIVYVTIINLTLHDCRSFRLPLNEIHFIRFNLLSFWFDFCSYSSLSVFFKHRTETALDKMCRRLSGTNNKKCMENIKRSSPLNCSSLLLISFYLFT